MPDPRVENNQYTGNSTKWVENADYFRCENVTLAYDFPKSMTKIADLRLSFSIQNLFTISSYKGSNPAGYSFQVTMVIVQMVLIRVLILLLELLLLVYV